MVLSVFGNDYGWFSYKIKYMDDEWFTYTGRKHYDFIVPFVLLYCDYVLVDDI